MAVHGRGLPLRTFAHYVELVQWAISTFMMSFPTPKHSMLCSALGPLTLWADMQARLMKAYVPKDQQHAHF